MSFDFSSVKDKKRKTTVSEPQNKKEEEKQSSSGFDFSSVKGKTRKTTNSVETDNSKKSIAYNAETPTLENRDRLKKEQQAKAQSELLDILSSPFENAKNDKTIKENVTFKNREEQKAKKQQEVWESKSDDSYSANLLKGLGNRYRSTVGNAFEETATAFSDFTDAEIKGYKPGDEITLENREAARAYKMGENSSWFMDPAKKLAAEMAASNQAGDIYDLASMQILEAQSGTNSQFAKEAISAADSGAQMLAYMSLPGGVKNLSAYMAIPLAAEKYNQVREAGGSKEEAFAKGVTSGAISYLVERSGGIGSAGNALEDIAAKNFVTRVVSESLQEGGEEFAQYGLEYVTDAIYELMYEGKISADFDIKEAIQQARIGALAGGGFGVVGSVNDAVTGNDQFDSSINEVASEVVQTIKNAFNAKKAEANIELQKSQETEKVSEPSTVEEDLKNLAKEVVEEKAEAEETTASAVNKPKRYTQTISQEGLEEYGRKLPNATEDTGKQVAAMYDPADGISKEAFAKAIDEAYKYGTFSYPIKEMDSDSVFAKDIPSEKKLQAYYMGQRNAETATITKANEQQKKALSGVKGKVVFEGNAATQIKNNQQRSTIRFINSVLKNASSMEYHIFASYEKDGKRVYKNSEGKVVPAPNGFYDPKNHQIWIDVNAGAKGQGIMLYTLTHEHVHDIKVWSAEHYNELVKITSQAFEHTGKSFKEAVDVKYAQYKKNHPDTTYEDAQEEVVAEAMSGLLSDEKALREFSEQIQKQDKGLWNRIKAWFNDVIARITAAYKGVEPESEEAKLLMEQRELFEKAQKVFAEAVVTAGQNYKNAGVEIDTATESVAPSVMFSERTWNESEYVKARNETARAIASELDVSLDKAYDYIDSINSVAKAIADDRARLDYDPNLDEHATVLKPNSEYGVTVDMSTLCAKRLLTTGTFDAIQKKLPNMVFDSEDIVKLRKMMMDRGYEVACGICYVESTRREMGRITQEFIDRYKIAQQTGKPIARVNASGQEVVLKSQGKTFMAEKEYTPNLGELNTTDIDFVKRDHPEVYNAYLAFMNARGQAKPKLLETRAEYKGEILKMFKKKDSVEKKNLEGGLRLQSFSDFELPHLIDMMQIVMDMSRVGLKSQAYTKVPKFAEAFGGTGIKINLSLIAKGSGVDENGNLVFDDIEGINHEEAFRIRDKFSNNVGTILVGKSDEHIRAAMADPRIDMIIPFHKSSWKESLYEALGLTGYTDYTKHQMEKPIDKSRGKIEQFHSDEYWDYSKTGDENAQIYLQKCREDGRTPVFPQFQNEPGYWKMLIDFKMYDNDGIGAPHEVVKPIFDDDYNVKILNEYKGGHRKLPVAQDVVDDFVKEYDTGTKFQDRDSDGRELSKEQVEFFKDSQARDKKGRLLTLYHGTRGKFTEFNPAHSDDKISFFFTSNREVAHSYSPWDTTLDPYSFVDENSSLEELAKVIETDRRYVSVKAVDIKEAEKAIAEFKEKGNSIIKGMEHLLEVTKGTRMANSFYMHSIRDNYSAFKKWIEEGIAPSYGNPLYTAGSKTNEILGVLKEGWDNPGEEVLNAMQELLDVAKPMQDKYDLAAAYNKEGTLEITDRFGKKSYLDKRQALKEANMTQSGGILPVYVNLVNPLILDAGGKNWNRIPVPPEMEGTTDRTELRTRDISEFAHSHGYDGVIFKNLVDMSQVSNVRARKSTVVVAFDSAQIKSVDNKTPTADPDIRYSDRDYSYEAFVNKPDMKVATIDDVVPKNRADVISQAKKNAAKIGKFNTKNGSVSVYVKDVDSDVIVSTDGLKHSLDRRMEINAPVVLKAGEILQNSIKINETTAQHPSAENSYVLIGAAQTDNNQLYIVRSVVNRFTNEVQSIDTLYAINAKTEPNLSIKKGTGREIVPDGSQQDAATITASNISIAELLEYVNQYFPEILPEDILKHFGHTARPEGKLGESALYQDRLSTADKNRVEILENKIERLEKELKEIESKAVLAGQMSQGKAMAKDLRRKTEAYENAIAKKKEQISAVRQQKNDLLAKAKAERVEAVERVRKADRERMEKAIADIKAKEKEKFDTAKAMSDEQKRAIIKKYQTSIKKATEGRHRTDIRGKIKRVVNELNTLLTRQTKERHIPLELQKPVADALDILNLDDPRYYNSRIKNLEAKIAEAKSSEERHLLQEELNKIIDQRTAFKDKIAGLKKAYEGIRTSTDPYIAVGYNENIAKMIDRVAEDIGDTLLRDMNMTQLQEVYDLYKGILKTVRDANKFFNEEKGASVVEAGRNVVSEIEASGKTIDQISKKKLERKKFFWNNLKPVYAFKKLGSKTLENLFGGILKGQGTWAKDVSEAKDFFERIGNKYGYKKWDKKKTFEFTSNTGKKFSLNLQQMMSLYAYSKRDQAFKHLTDGGFVFDNKETIKKNGKEYVVNTAQAYNISAATLQQIIGKLSTDQRMFVDEMQKYLSETMGAKGNEVSRAMYDIELFREAEGYFPLKSAKQFLYDRNEVTNETRQLVNSGFTKPIQPGANNPIILTGFMDVWANHVNDMSMYHAFVMPIENFNKVYNFQFGRSEESDSKSVKSAIQDSFTEAANQYIEQLLKDINGGARTDSRESNYKRLVGNWKKAAVFASASVVVQQPSAIGRAFAEINPIYFMAPTEIGVLKHKKQWEQLKKYAPIAVIKEMGYFDTDMGQSTAEFIKGEKTLKDRADDIFGWAPAKADEYTWCAIWDAVKRETKAKHKDLNVNSEEFLKIAGERFTEVIDRTQVYDSVLARSGNMRSKSIFMQMLTAFMAEPTTSANMVEQAFREAKAGHKKKAMAYINSVGASVVINSLLVSFVYALRDDDEDERFHDKYLEALLKELADGFNPLTYIPLAKDVWSIFQGWDVERVDMSLFKDLYDNLEKEVKKVKELTEGIMNGTLSEEEIKAAFGEILKEYTLPILDTIASMKGIPLKNLRRDFYTMPKNTFKIFNQNQKELSYSEKYLWDILHEAFLDQAPFGNVFFESKYKKLVDGMVSGDKVYLERLKKTYSSEDAYNNAIKAAIKDAFISKDISAIKAEQLLVKYHGDEPNEAKVQVALYDVQSRGFDDVTFSNAKDYKEFCEPYGISEKVFYEFCLDTKDIKGDYDSEGDSIPYSKTKKIMPYIDRLPLTAEQKTAVAKSFGWSDKTIREYKLW